MTMEKNTEKAAEGRTVHHVQIEIDPEEPEVPFVETLADIKGVDQSDLDPLHSNLDNLIGGVLLSPPPEENQAEISFTYEGFRVTLYHDGHAVLREV